MNHYWLHQPTHSDSALPTTAGQTRRWTGVTDRFNNLGGGGGGGFSGTGGGGATNGGSGLAIFYYTSPTQLGTGGTVTSSGSGNSTVWYHVYKTTGSSNFTF
jgi:hypothetical protein